MLHAENVAFICDNCKLELIWFCRTGHHRHGVDCPRCSALMKEYSVRESPEQVDQDYED